MKGGYCSRLFVCSAIATILFDTFAFAQTNQGVSTNSAYAGEPLNVILNPAAAQPREVSASRAPDAGQASFASPSWTPQLPTPRPPVAIDVPPVFRDGPPAAEAAR